VEFPLKFSQWKGARFGIFCYGGSGSADVDYVRCDYGQR
jgi:hypothetical protein